MADYGHEIEFGVFITPQSAEANEIVALAELADVQGLDLVTFQDHPYQPRFLDTWTLLSVVAARTSNVRLAPNVANLPLRPPVILARSVASLDILSGGRVELGLGSGAFWEAIAKLGGPALTPGQGVDALSEAIKVIRLFWAANGDPVSFDGDHYRLDAAPAGPAPAHDVGIWLGAYKPRMLRLTGATADGWLPSLGYLGPDGLAAANAAIDEAAAAAGRPTSAIRRLYNINGSFGRGEGLLAGSPADWAEQLADLALEHGISGFILAVAAADDLRRYATEVAPAVRELVERERERGSFAVEAPDNPAVAAPTGPVTEPFAVVPTADDGVRHSGERAWDESDRPRGPAPDPERRYSADQQAAGQHLIDVHDGLRAEVGRIRELIDQLASGSVDANAVRTLINRMTIRQNNWTLGVYCQSYCRMVSGHHTLEDEGIFPHLKRSDPELEAVIDRLGSEHGVIAELLDRVDEALVDLAAGEPDGLAEVRAAVDLLTDAMASHLSYEEHELVEPIARFGFY